MKKILLFITFLFCLNLNAQKGKIYMSSWSEMNLSDSEISAEKFTCDNKGKLCYFICNDKDNLSVDMRITDAEVQNRILKEGMTIWINMDNKQEKNLGVRFPIGFYRATGGVPNGPEIPKFNKDGSLITPLSVANRIQLIGFTGENVRQFPSDNPDNFRGIIKYDNKGVLHYRLIMPANKLPFRNSKESIEVLPFELGVEYGFAPFSGPGPGSGGQRSSGAPPSGAGRPPRGEMSGGARDAGNPNSEDPNAKPAELIWIKNIKLATGQ